MYLRADLADRIRGTDGAARSAVGQEAWRMAGNCTESGRTVTNKITSILTVFTEGSEHSLTEIARLAGLPVSTAHRLATELTSGRLLDRTDEGNYRVGLLLRMIGSGADASPSVAQRGSWVLDDLATSLRCRTRLGVLAGLDVAYMEKRPGTSAVTAFSSRATLPAHPTALGRALLAFADPRLVDAVVTRGLRPYTRHTIVAPDRFRRALSITRLTRVATTRWELEPGVAGIAMPVFGAGGEAVAAIELTTTDIGRELPAMTAALAVASRSLSRELATSSGEPAAAAAAPVVAMG